MSMISIHSRVIDHQRKLKHWIYCKLGLIDDKPYLRWEMYRYYADVGNRFSCFMKIPQKANDNDNIYLLAIITQ